MKSWKVDNINIFFSDILKIEEKELIEVLKKDKKEYYENFIKIKKKNGFREICLINKDSELYNLQINICDNFLNNIIISDNAYGFRKNSNYLEYLYPHIDFYKERYYLRLDIENFFGSINNDVLRECLSYYFKINDNLTQESKDKLLDYSMDILTYEGKVIQGAISSPVISNIVFRQIDIRISRYCRKFGIIYTRYADDLLFSSDSNSLYKKSFILGIKKILASKKFSINYNKIKRGYREISLGGYVVSDSIRLSRKKLSNLNRILFYLENNKLHISEDYLNKLNEMIYRQGGNEKIYSKYHLINYLAGNRSFLISILKYSEDKKYTDKLSEIVDRIEKIILEIYDL